MLADILPTGYEVGVRNGHVHPGDVVAVVGAGPIGLAADPRRPAATARATSSRSTWPMPGSRRPSSSAPTSSSTTAARTRSPSSLELTGGLGADVAIEASACRPPSSWRPRLIRPGGHVANIGVHGDAATLHLEDLWSRNVTITTGLVDTSSTPTLLELVAQPAARRHPLRHPPLPARRVRWPPTTPSPTPATPALSRSCSPGRHDHAVPNPGFGTFGPAARADRPSRTCPGHGHGGGNRLRPLETPCPPNPPSWPPPSPLRHAT